MKKTERPTSRKWSCQQNGIVLWKFHGQRNFSIWGAWRSKHVICCAGWVALDTRANSNIFSFFFSRGKILAQVSEVPNFDSCRIRPTRLKLELKRSWFRIRHKIYISQLRILLDSMSEFNSRTFLFTLQVLDSLLFSNSWFSAIFLYKKSRLGFVLLLAPLAIEEACLAEDICSICCQKPDARYES